MIRLNPLNDYLFQKYMGEKGDEEQLLSLINAVLAKTRDTKLKAIEILENKTLSADVIGSKTSVLDVRAIADAGTRVNIEVQIRNVGEMDRRSLFYWSREYSKGIDAGQYYNELPNVIAINIINYEFIPVDEFHTAFHLWEDSHKDVMLTDALEIHFVDMVKYKRLQHKDIKNSPLHRWLTFFDKDTPEETLKEVLAMEAAIQKADDKIAFLASDKDAMRQYEMREKAMWDYVSGMNYAKREGRKEGIVEGRKVEAIEIALKMLNRGTPIEFIIEDTGLDEATIKQIKNGKA
jgi:predicted transposase/invertase (TIGR01784 family)